MQLFIENLNLVETLYLYYFREVMEATSSRVFSGNSYSAILVKNFCFHIIIMHQIQTQNLYERTNIHVINVFCSMTNRPVYKINYIQNHCTLLKEIFIKVSAVYLVIYCSLESFHVLFLRDAGWSKRRLFRIIE